MIRLARALLAFSTRLDLGATQVYPEVYTFEITASTLVFKKHEGPMALPLGVDRSSDDKPNFLYDSAKHILRMNGNEKFWPQMLRIIQEVGNAKVQAAVEIFVAANWRGQVLGKQGGNTLFRAYQLKAGAEALPDLDEKFKKTNPPPEDALPDTIWVVPLYKGTPIVHLPEFQAWVRDKYLNCLGATIEPPTQEPDVIAGGMCTPCKLHRKIRDFPGKGSKTTLFNHNDEAYQFEGRTDANVPASFATIFAYTEAGSYLAANNSVRLQIGEGKRAESAIVMIWPTHQGVSHPIIPVACEIIGSYPKDAAAWDALSALGGLDATDLTLVVAVSMGKGRARLVGLTNLTVGQLRDNLLRVHAAFPSVYTLRSLLERSNENPKKQLLTPDLHLPVLWAMLTDTGYPHNFQTRLWRYFALPIARVWCSFINKEPWMNPFRDYNVEPPKEEEYFTGSRANTAAYKFGRLLACLAEFKLRYHGFKPNMVHASRILDGGIMRPVKALGDAIRMKNVYLEGLQRRNQTSAFLAALQLTFFHLLSDLEAWTPGRFTDADKVNVRMGWERQCAYDAWRRSWSHRQWEAKHPKQAEPTSVAESM